MTTTEELIDTILFVVRTQKEPIPISFANHAPDVAIEIVKAVARKCAAEGFKLKAVRIDEDLAAAGRIAPGSEVAEESNAAFAVEHGLGRQVIFVKT